MQEPDYCDWKGRQLWTLIEAACLLSREEPVEWQSFNAPDQKTLRARIYRDLKDANLLGTLKYYESLDGTAHHRRVKPDECVTWAAGLPYTSIPEALLDLKKRDPSEIPEQRANRLRRRIEEERGKGNRAFLKTVAKEEGISIGRLKQIRDKQDLSSPKGKTSSRRAKPPY